MAPPPSASQIARFRAVLGVEPNASLAEISTAFRGCAIKHHPDVGGDHATMVEINNAHDWLREEVVALASPSAAQQQAAHEAAAAEAANLLSRQQKHARDLAHRAAKLAAQNAAAKDLVEREATWGPGYYLRGVNAATTPLSSTSGTAYGPRPETMPPPPRLAAGKKRTRASQSIGASNPPKRRAASQEKPNPTRVESAAETMFDSIFAGVKWDRPHSNQKLRAEQPDFLAWLENENAWDWHMCVGERNGFKMMGSQRDGQVFLWKFCCATEAISMAVHKF